MTPYENELWKLRGQSANFFVIAFILMGGILLAGHPAAEFFSWKALVYFFGISIVGRYFSAINFFLMLRVLVPGLMAARKSYKPDSAEFSGIEKIFYFLIGFGTAGFFGLQIYELIKFGVLPFMW